MATDCHHCHLPSTPPWLLLIQPVAYPTTQQNTHLPLRKDSNSKMPSLTACGQNGNGPAGENPNLRGSCAKHCPAGEGRPLSIHHVLMCVGKPQENPPHSPTKSPLNCTSSGNCQKCANTSLLLSSCQTCPQPNGRWSICIFPLAQKVCQSGLIFKFQLSFEEYLIENL